MNETITKGFGRETNPEVMSPSVSYSFSLYRPIHETWDLEELLERERLVKKLDGLRSEPTVSFGSGEEALHFLRSRVKPSKQ